MPFAIHSIFTKSRAFLWARGTNTPVPERDPLHAQAPSISLINLHLQPATGLSSRVPQFAFSSLSAAKSMLSIGEKLTSHNFTPELMNNARKRERESSMADD
ncbi:hypothetical protein CEXT_679501 [Caerostris extrusa]|uniref:Uncharacterized protein n=1 Tax=Caerostris extrusa TaxID=172846 RepID=A0AAV4Y7L8_CAEEX|nr:hypothetical protein CEXT_679501 [Caerostris extrusa]